MTKPGYIQVYKSLSGPKTQRWRWRVIAPNGKLIATSGEGYSRRSHAKSIILKLKFAFAHWPVEVQVA